MIKKLFRPAAGLLAAALLLSACSGAGRVFGFDRSIPDEFAVVSRAPLTLPPDYNLRPPQPGAPRPQEGTAAQRAQAAILGDPAAGGFRQNGLGQGADMQTAAISPGALALLESAGAGGADPNIRQVVNQEATDLLVADRSFIDSLIFWRDPIEPGTVVDPEAEARRLQANAALGEPLNRGEVPIIERKRQAPLEGLFDF